MNGTDTYWYVYHYVYIMLENAATHAIQQMWLNCHSKNYVYVHFMYVTMFPYYLLNALLFSF